MNERQLSLDTFYSFVEEKVSESNKIEFKKFSFPNGKMLMAAQFTLALMKAKIK